MFDPRAADGLSASYELRLGEDCFRALVDDGRFEIARGIPDRSDTTIETDTGTLAALVYEGGDLTKALRCGKIKIEGNESVVERLLGLFPLPELATPAVGA
jgi:alkyl sulfatase BDS1-like metallo-beta-lactamase superfamily hydrolase